MTKNWDLTELKERLKLSLSPEEIENIIDEGLRNAGLEKKFEYTTEEFEKLIDELIKKGGWAEVQARIMKVKILEEKFPFKVKK
jgi:isopropylmalate/homocitrate/citramalate synthase